MGLDVYLYRKTYIGDNDKVKKALKGLIKGVNPDRLDYIIEEVGYWRKFNALHRWFVLNCQDGNDDCGLHYVDPEQLEALIHELEEVDVDHSKADDLMPTKGGFFFGDTKYDDDYFDDIKETIELLKRILKEPNQGVYLYQSSW